MLSFLYKPLNPILISVTLLLYIISLSLLFSCIFCFECITVNTSFYNIHILGQCFKLRLKAAFRILEMEGKETISDHTI